VTPEQFLRKWQASTLSERSAAHQHFLDLCALLGEPPPAEADPTGETFTFEKGGKTAAGGRGWADVWKKGVFAWEYKGPGKDLTEAYLQLKKYADMLENPPLLIVSDTKRIEIHTNFTSTVKVVYRLELADLANPETRETLRAAFSTPEKLRPGITRHQVTTAAAEKFSQIAHSLRGKGYEPQRVAHFLNRLVFCMFAEDVDLLPNQLFSKLAKASVAHPEAFQENARQLFAAMAKGGTVAFEIIAWFNGGLFEDAATLPLDGSELRDLLKCAELDWSSIEPSIFGTLFERGLDPNQRAKHGAHYTDTHTIMKIVQPVVLEPWLSEWEAEKTELSKQIEKARKSISEAAKTRYFTFLDRLRRFRVLDPACGSGNFLYLALRGLKDIEKRVIHEAESLGLPAQFPSVGPEAVLGIELNSYAAELARVTIWIGEIQWMIENGFGASKDPILRPLNQIECRDAILNADGSETQWPAADVIIGNPPFLGSRNMNMELGHTYTETVRAAYDGRVPRNADFVCFWFEKANDAIRIGSIRRAGLVATNSIRQGANREVLKHAAATTRIFDAWADEEWWDKDTAVRVSLVCFGHSGRDPRLDGQTVREIFADLTGPKFEEQSVDLTKATKIHENSGISFQGVIPRAEIRKKRKVELGLPDASFNLDGAAARAMLAGPSSIDGHPISDVVRPYWVADDVTTRPLDRYVIHFGERTEAEASKFEGPFAAIQSVRLHREQMLGKDDVNDRKTWWRFSRSRLKMFKAFAEMTRYAAIPRHAKHFLVTWMDKPIVPDSALVVIARDDDTFFGILQSHIHEAWALRQGSAIGVGNDPRYTPESCFETFPFPDGLTPNIPATSYADNPHAQAIAKTARSLVQARDRWCNPPELVAWVRTAQEELAGFPLRPTALPGHERELSRRTLTNLYNSPAPWLKELHSELDKAVAAAYGWQWPLPDDEVLNRLFQLNRSRSQTSVLR
jgi:type II restriction/modification system DNA methylase subunit YeeA